MLSSNQTAGAAFTRRGFVTASATAVGAVALSPLLAACGNSASTGGATTKTGLAAALPDYIPLTAGPAATYPSVAGADGATTDPGFLSYPSKLIKTVATTPGSGGSFTAIAPSWNPIPAAGNEYYQAINTALGATFDVQPANGNNYATIIPPLIAADKLPDWLSIPSWLNATFNTGELASTRLADLTPYLSGDNIKQYPNLAAIPSGGWQAGAWDDKLYGIPSYTSGQSFAGALFYRKDLLDAQGITPAVATADDLYSLGRQVNNPKGGVWAFDNLFIYLQQVFGIPSNGFYLTSAGKLASAFEHPAYAETLAWCLKAAKAGMVHPDALAGISASPSRFQSGKVVIEGNGTGSWNAGDAETATSAAPGYVRQAFPLFSSDGSTPAIGLGGSSGWLSYLNKSLTPAQIKECLAIANYLAAPYGSYEYTLITYGTEGSDYTMTSSGPNYTTQGANTAKDSADAFFGSPQAAITNPGYPAVTTAYCAWSADTVKHAYKPVFWNMNISLPNQYATASAAAQLTDAYTAVSTGKQPVSYWSAAVTTWKKSGGDAMVAWYQKNIVDKYGTGQ
jgi:putative aldouronate transport system substrate-binding protein